MSKETKAAKNNIQAVTGRGPLTEFYIKNQFPYPVDVIGKPGSTGGAVFKERELVGGFRHPDWTLPTQNGDSRITTDHLEFCIARETSPEQTRTMAQRVVTRAKGGELPTYGGETERWAYKNGHLIPLPLDYQVESLQGLLETTTEPQKDSRKVALAIAEDIHKSAITFPDYNIVGSSMPISYYPRDEGLEQTTDGLLGSYISLTIDHVRPLVGIAENDLITQQTADQVAQVLGYKTFADMEKRVPDLSFWANAAAHANVESEHEENHETGTLYTSRSLQNAEVDFIYTDFATAAELLMMSQPLAFGKLFSVQDDKGNSHILKDVGGAYRYTLQTTQESPLVRTSGEGNRRITHLLYTGQVATIDRGSFVNLPIGTKLHERRRLFPSIHGRGRERIGAKALPTRPLGRTEYTGRRESISIIDQLASNTLIRLYIVSANDAIAHGMHPSEYFGRKYPYMQTAHQHKRLNHLYNLYGTSNKEVHELLQQNLRYLDDMSAEYPALENDIAFVRARIQNMYVAPTVNTLRRYASESTSPIFNIVGKEAEIYTPDEIVKHAAEYQQEIGEQIHAKNGDMMAVINNTRSKYYS